jgi:hypothetical protein
LGVRAPDILSAMSFLRTTARGRSEATPARLLLGVATVVIIAVAILLVAIYAIQAAL